MLEKIRTLAVGVAGGIPMEKIKACMRMDDLSDEILDRLYDGKAVPLDKVKELNELFYKTFPERQDGEEFTESEAPSAPVDRSHYWAGYMNAMEYIRGIAETFLRDAEEAAGTEKGDAKK